LSTSLTVYYASRKLEVRPRHNAAQFIDVGSPTFGKSGAGRSEKSACPIPTQTCRGEVRPIAVINAFAHKALMQWVRVTKWVLGIGAVAGGVSMAVFWPSKAIQIGPVVEARVIRFGNNASRWYPDLIWVVAATPDGRTGQDTLSIDELNRLDCKVGDLVKARAVGAMLAVDAKTCSRPK
jgi:hypothetical protein